METEKERILVDRPIVKGPPLGFSKGINDQLISMSSLAHFKAAGLLGFALTLTGLMLSSRPETTAGVYAHNMGISLMVLSALCAAIVIYPKEATRKGGQVFWGDIVTHENMTAYVQSLLQLSPSDAEEEYAATNYFFSTVLKFKYKMVRWAVSLLMGGCLLAVAGRFLP